MAFSCSTARSSKETTAFTSRTDRRITTSGISFKNLTVINTYQRHAFISLAGAAARLAIGGDDKSSIQVMTNDVNVTEIRERRNIFYKIAQCVRKRATNFVSELPHFGIRLYRSKFPNRKKQPKINMKKLILPLSVLFLTMSCSDEEVKPAVESATEYYLQSQEAGVEIGLTIVNNNEVRNFEANAYVKHASIPSQYWRANNLSTYKVEGEVQRIEILARGPHFYAVNLVDVQLTDDGLYVANLFIDIPGAPFIELQAQTFRKR
jgi:hypothetical protein